MKGLQALRTLVLGETWALPVGVAGTMVVAGILESISGSGGWWKTGGGLVLMAGLFIALLASVRRELRGHGVSSAGRSDSSD